jgi:hypothetical protein
MLRVPGVEDEVVVWDSGFHIYKVNIFTTSLCPIHPEFSYNLLNIFLKVLIKII